MTEQQKDLDGIFHRASDFLSLFITSFENNPDFKDIPNFTKVFDELKAAHEVFVMVHDDWHRLTEATS